MSSFSCFPSCNGWLRLRLRRSLVASAVAAVAGAALSAGASAQGLSPAATPSASVQPPGGAASAGNAKAGQGIAQNGLPQNGVAACATCHGARGEGSVAFPPLAGNGTTYLLEQLNHFAANRREQAVMHPIAKALSAQQRADVAAFYAGQPREQKPLSARMEPATPQDAGAWLAQRGRWSDGIPACAQCHGPEGLGVGEHFPALAGLGAAYMQQQISAWQTGKRPPGPLQLMSSVAQRLTPADITAVAAYYARLHGGGAGAAGATAPVTVAAAAVPAPVSAKTKATPTATATAAAAAAAITASAPVPSSVTVPGPGRVPAGAPATAAAPRSPSMQGKP